MYQGLQVVKTEAKPTREELVQAKIRLVRATLEEIETLIEGWLPPSLDPAA